MSLISGLMNRQGDHIVGDVTYGGSGTATVSVQGPAVAYFWVDVDVEIEAQFPGTTASIVDRVLDRYRQKLLGIPHSPAFQPLVDLLSKHVNRRRGEVVKAILRTTWPWTKYSVALSRPNGDAASFTRSLIADQNATPIQFAWNGTDNDGNLVHNGEYRLSISASDPLQRSQYFQFGVEVNNEGRP